MISLPALLLRNAVLFPGNIAPVELVRFHAVLAAERALKHSTKLWLGVQRDPTCEAPRIQDMHRIGVIAKPLHVLKFPDGTGRVALETEQRAELISLDDMQGHWTASVGTLDVPTIGSTDELILAYDHLNHAVAEYEKVAEKLGRERPLVGVFQSPSACSAHIDSVFSILGGSVEQRQKWLELDDLIDRAHAAIEALDVQKSSLERELAALLLANSRPESRSG